MLTFNQSLHFATPVGVAGRRYAAPMSSTLSDYSGYTMRVVCALFLMLYSNILFAEQYTYFTTYKGLVVGKSKYENVVGVLGKPLEEKPVSSNYRLSYGDFYITLFGRSGTINSITIIGKDYRDINGFSVGDNQEKVIEKTKDYRESFYAADFTHGVLYWFENGVISKIVLAGSLVDRKSDNNSLHSAH